jgi:amino acid adenylation domain-containing protein
MDISRRLSYCPTMEEKTTATDHPASVGQEALWHACELAHDSSAFSILWSLHLRGPLDHALVRRALNHITGRHEALRTVFNWTRDGLRQRVLPAEPVECLDFFAATNRAREEIVRRFGLEPFDRQRGPLFRFALLTRPDTDHELLCGFHHLVSDGYSKRIFIDEFLQHLAGRDVQAPTSTYADYCAWQADCLADGRWESSRNFWQNIYGDAPVAWDLPTDRPRPRSPQYASGIHVSALDSEVAGCLARFATQRGTTPFRVAFAAFFAFLHRLTGRRDILAITTLVGRTDPRFARLMGFFVNAGGIRVKLDDTTSFTDLTTAVHAAVAETLVHQHYPHALAVQTAAPRREVGREAFSPVGFTKLPTTRTRTAGGIELTDLRILLHEAGHDLSVYLHQDRGAYRFTWSYRTALFDVSTIETFAASFTELLRHALEQPLVPLGQLSLVAPATRRVMLNDWQGVERAREGTVHVLVEAQATRTPDRIAVVAPDVRMTYGEVNAAADGLAARLRSGGIGPGCIVPILMEASAEVLLAELAVMKTGAAFAPLDPAWPLERRRALLEQLGSALILVKAGSPEDHDLEAIVVTTGELAPDEPSDPHGVTPDAPVYCLFTSGSTGAPKAAVNLHRGIVNRLWAMTERFGAPTHDVVLATSAPFFDSSVWQYFWPLTGGGRTVILPASQTTNPTALPALVERHGITVTDLVPAILAHAVRHLREHPEESARFASLRQLLIGGEAMAASPVREFLACCPHVRITNAYGPTETSIGVIFHEVSPEVSDPVPIGRPLPNVRAVILDDNLQLIPPGWPGELCLGGTCVGAGYLGDAEATARAFVPNPLPELGVPTLYRTGDLARFRPDGVIEYLGRRDQQVKLRGIRIEPREIEAQLSRHPQVQESAVVLRRDEAGQERLAAFLVPGTPGSAPNATEVRRWLEEWLPASMVPSVFFALDTLPLTASGKVDRLALARLEGNALASDRPHEPPVDDLERGIVAMWEELLKREPIGRHDHFFELGGDSLLAIRFVAAFVEDYGRSLEVRMLFESPTPAELATFLRREQAKPPAEERGVLADILMNQRALVANWQGQRATADGLIFTLNEADGRRGLFWCFQGYREFAQMAAVLGPGQPLHGMRSGHLFLEYNETNVMALAGQYAEEIHALQPAGALLLGGNCQGAVIALATAEVLTRRGRQIELLILMEEARFRPYAGRVGLLFGRESKLNPYRGKTNPENIFRHAYAGGFSVHFIDGGHGQFFEDPHLPSLGAVVRGLLASGSEPGQPDA